MAPGPVVYLQRNSWTTGRQNRCFCRERKYRGYDSAQKWALSSVDRAGWVVSRIRAKRNYQTEIQRPAEASLNRPEDGNAWVRCHFPSCREKGVLVPPNHPHCCIHPPPLGCLRGSRCFLRLTGAALPRPASPPWPTILPPQAPPKSTTALLLRFLLRLRHLPRPLPVSPLPLHHHPPS